jgi:catechol 2,3-dioxygenase-like lactoylglutathione lyase family enzyme
VAGLAWLEFEKPDLDRAERFGADFGFTAADRTPDTLLLRGRQARPRAWWCAAASRPGSWGRPSPRPPGMTWTGWRAVSGGTVTAHQGGHAVLLRDPSGFPVRVVHGVPEFPALPGRARLPLNFGSEPVRANATQRPTRRPAEIQRLGHVVLGTTRFRAALDWYAEMLGLIVSDFLYLDGQRDRGPAMAFIRCDLGSVPADHHTLAMALRRDHPPAGSGQREGDGTRRARPRHHHRLPGHRPHQLGVTRRTAASGWFSGTHHGPFGSIDFYPERTWVPAAGSHPADLMSSASSDAMSSDTASIRARGVNACGKFPRCSPVVVSISSAYSRSSPHRVPRRRQLPAPVPRGQRPRQAGVLLPSSPTTPGITSPEYAWTLTATRPPALPPTAATWPRSGTCSTT